MDTHNRLQQLLTEHNWSKYRLSKKSGLSESTIANIFKRNSDPTITTLMAVCNGFGITLSQFFAEQEMVELSPELRELFENQVPLALEQKAAILLVIKTWYRYCCQPQGSKSILHNLPTF